MGPGHEARRKRRRGEPSPRQGTAFEKFIGKGQAKNLFFKVPSGVDDLRSPPSATELPDEPRMRLASDRLMSNGCLRPLMKNTWT